MRRGLVRTFIVASALLPATIALAAGPTTSVQGDYLMTLYVPIAQAHDVDDALRVVNHPDNADTVVPGIGESPGSGQSIFELRALDWDLIRGQH